MTPADLEYVTTGLFTRFVPNTPQGEDAWREMAQQNDGVAAVLTIHAGDVIAQLKKAGYTVAEMEAKTISSEEIDNLLKELGE